MNTCVEKVQNDVVYFTNEKLLWNQIAMRVIQILRRQRKLMRIQIQTNLNHIRCIMLK
jgi:hypothetical protein